MPFDRVIAAVLIWIVVVAYLGWRRKYAMSNLAAAAIGFGLFLVAFAGADNIDFTRAVGGPGAWVLLGALGGGLVEHGVSIERARSIRKSGARLHLSDGAGETGT